MANTWNIISLNIWTISMTFSFMVHWIWICTVLSGQDTNHKKKNQNKKTHKKEQTRWCKRKWKGKKKTIYKISSRVWKLSPSSKPCVPARRLQRPIKFIMSPFTCTQTLHYARWAKPSLIITCNENQIISRVVHFENLMDDGYSTSATKTSNKNHICHHDVEYCVHVTNFTCFSFLPGNRQEAILNSAPPNRWPYVNESSLSATESWKTGGDNIFGCGNERQRHTAKRRRSDGNRIIKLRALRKTPSHCVSHWWLKSRQESSSRKPTANLTETTTDSMAFKHACCL